MKRWLASTSVFLVLAAVLVLCALLGLVMARTTLVRLGYELSALEEQHQKLVAAHTALKTELAARRAPDRMLREGKQRFRLELASPEQVVTVRAAASSRQASGSEQP